MTRWPLILVSPDFDDEGQEHSDRSIRLSARYQEALISAGALPLTMPATISRDVIAECVRRSDGVLLTGGSDIEPRLYSARLAGPVRKTVNITPDSGERDFRESL